MEKRGVAAAVVITAYNGVRKTLIRMMTGAIAHPTRIPQFWVQKFAAVFFEEAWHARGTWVAIPTTRNDDIDATIVSTSIVYIPPHVPCGERLYGYITKFAHFFFFVCGVLSYSRRLRVSENSCNNVL